jgi:hypothetical protein
MTRYFSVFFFLVFSFSVFAQSSLLEFGPSKVSGESIIHAPMAPVIFLDQQPNGVNGLFADETCALCPTGQQTVADNFNATVGNATTGITELVIWGGYYPEDIPNTTDDFTIIFHADNAGQPGAVIATFSGLQAASRVQTGVILFGTHEYMFTFDFSASPIMLPAGTATFWIQLFNNSVESGNFYWETGNLDATNGIAGSGWYTTCPATAWNLDPATDLSAVVNGDDNIGGGGNAFFDDFDSYTAGVQLCTQTTNWETWSGTTGGVDDPYVSSNYSYSNPNTVVIVADNDLVRQHGNLTSGTWYISFLFYMPSGHSGYFNTMNQFERPSTFVWGMDSFFDVGGIGRLDTTGAGGGGVTVPFTWTEATWNQVVVIIDLDTHTAEYWIGTNQSNFTQIATWDWTQAGTKPNQLAVNDIFGAAATDEMYVDNFYFDNAMPPIIPVELTSFTAVSNNGVVELNWQTATEVNNHMFEIQRKAESSEYYSIGYVEGSGTTTEPKNYSYTDNTVETGTYTYRLKQIDFNGTFTYSPEVEVDVKAPLTFNLQQNYPNPFNPSTKINYSIPQAGNVRLAVYNIVGEEVAVLVNGYTDAGRFHVTFDASNLPSGVYLYKLQSANSVQTKKMILMK